MPSDAFVCPRQPGGLTLTPDACAGLYRRGKRAEPWESPYRCRGCETGAAHAGERPPERREVELAHPCRICGQKRGGKMIYGVLCVSCYNRVAEAMRGRNGKGSAPVKMAGTRVHGITVVTRGGLVFAGNGTGLLWFGRGAASLPGAQQRSLFEL